MGIEHHKMTFLDIVSVMNIFLPFLFYSDNDSYRVHVKTHTRSNVVKMGEHSECSIIETWNDFNINGIKGWGAAEWEFKNEKTPTKY